MITTGAKMAWSLRQNIFAGCFPMIKSATDLIIVTNAAVGGAEVTTDYGRGGVEGGTTMALAGKRSIIAGLVTVTVDPRTAGLDTLDTTATAQT